MRVFDIYDIRYGRCVDTVHAYTKQAALDKAAARTGIPLEHLAGALQ